MATVRGKQKNKQTGKHCRLIDKLVDKLVTCLTTQTSLSIAFGRFILTFTYNGEDTVYTVEDTEWAVIVRITNAVLPPVFLIHCHTGGCWVRVWESCKGNVQIKTTHSKWGLFVLIKNHKLTCRIRLHYCVFFSMSWFCATPLGLHWTRNTLTLVSSYSKERNINLVMPLNLHCLVNTPLNWIFLHYTIYGTSQVPCKLAYSGQTEVNLVILLWHSSGLIKVPIYCKVDVFLQANVRDRTLCIEKWWLALCHLPPTVASFTGPQHPIVYRLISHK